MGASQSAERSFMPAVPVKFSQDLIDALEDSEESDLSRHYDQAVRLESTVARELNAIATDAHRLVQQQLQAAEAKPAGGEITSPALLEEIEKLKAQLDTHKQALEQRQEAKPFDAPKQRLVECLKQHDRKPLLCLSEFEQFRDAVEKVAGES